MSDPRNSVTARSGRVLRASMLAAGLGFGLFAGLAAASAAPLSGAGLAAPGLATEPIAYRHLKNRQLYVAELLRLTVIPLVSAVLAGDAVRRKQRSP